MCQLTVLFTSFSSFEFLQSVIFNIPTGSRKTYADFFTVTVEILLQKKIPSGQSQKG